MKKRKYIYWASGIGLLLVIIIFFSIYTSYFQSNRIPIQSNKQRPSHSMQYLENINKFLHEKDKERINSFIERRGWEMSTTESGLWYQIEEKGDGQDINIGDYVKLDYEMRLLDGDLLYSSRKDGKKVVQVGKGKNIKGLHEGLQLLNEGDIARFIIPPHLAYGLIGDGERVPAKAILYYKLEVLEVAGTKIQP
ncbi:MAG: FKBP-type peptidyl-prolyl cis-trans isomerase [Bacteroidales bacterium]